MVRSWCRFLACKLIVSGSVTGRCSVWNAVSGEACWDLWRGTLVGELGVVFCDGNLIVSGSDDGTVRCGTLFLGSACWDLCRGTLVG